ncbi:hypothetical protein RFI_34803, partial [Reticulomyxa filosa]
ELQKVIGEMPNNKAVFLDQMSNEWIKSLMEISPTTTTNLFNLFVGKIFKLITTILTRSQLYVTAGYYASRPFIMRSGTSQEYSMSGPLFNLYINDMIKDINNTRTEIKAYGESAPACLFYADDIITISKKWRSNNEILTVIKEYCKTMEIGNKHR